MSKAGILLHHRKKNDDKSPRSTKCPGKSGKGLEKGGEEDFSVEIKEKRQEFPEKRGFFSV